MLLERIGVLSVMWVLAAWALYLCRKQSPLHALVIAIATTALIGGFYPVLSLVIPPATWRHVSHLSHELTLSVQVQFACWMLGLVAAAHFVTHRGWLAANDGAAERESDASARGRDFVIAWGLVCSGAVLYALYVQKVGLHALMSRHDYAEKYLLSTGLGPLQFGLSMVIAGCLWAAASRLSRRDKLPFVLVGAATIVWSIAFISVRTYAALILLGYAAIWCRRNSFQIRKLHPGLVVALLCAYVGLESFSLFRGVYRNDFDEALRTLSAQGEAAFASVVGGSELTHPFVTAAEVMHDHEAGELAGSSVIDALRALVPVSIDADRPLSLSEKFAHSNYAAFASRGGGTAFSFVAEAWLDFGAFLGPFAFGAVFGFVLLWIERRSLSHPDGVLARISPYLLFYVAVHHRNELATLSKQTLMLALAVVPLWIAAEAMRGSIGRRRRTLERSAG